MIDLPSWLDPATMSYADMAAHVTTLTAVTVTVAARVAMADLRRRWSR